MLKKFYSTALSAISVLFVLLLWWLITSRHWVNPLFVPSPSKVWAAFIQIFQDGYKGSTLLHHLLASLFRLGSAFALALATAIPLGLISGSSFVVRSLLDPFIEFYRPLPPLAYYTILVLWLGIGDSSKIFLLYLAAFAPLYIAVVAGVRRVPLDRIHAARSLGANRRKLFAHILLPSALPEIFTGIRTAIGVSYTTLVAAEMVAAISGIGWMVLDASKFLRSDIIFAGIILMGLIAIAIDSFIRWLERRWVPWSGKE
ncbi:ABC transporter permease [Paenibacillus radicis (ex Gao et al. 2016)]|uniref:Taurine ABC transporter permease n=1 Tax=Paenibacillus radicis (ex Gao et al. 2016) TaxID=1737354 RepID=A0A917GT71_9BACL|nr:ABC transporter permease subunit [Paenibacillus radicis (ex Gao et al. 2016)]GGG56123.1 taurine ABC transporter permease [Paenibacillus radicis (ex Gao et al. 2016)]